MLRRKLLSTVPIHEGSEENLDTMVRILQTISLELDTHMLGLDLLKHIEDALNAVGVVPILDQLARLPDNLGIEPEPKVE